MTTTMRAISESAAVALLRKRALFRIALISRKGIELCSFRKTQLPSCSWEIAMARATTRRWVSSGKPISSSTSPIRNLTPLKTAAGQSGNGSSPREAYPRESSKRAFLYPSVESTTARVWFYFSVINACIGVSSLFASHHQKWSSTHPRVHSHFDCLPIAVAR